MLPVNIKTAIYSLAACLIGVGTLLAFAHETLAPQRARACDIRFGNGSAFRFERDGALLAGADILARSAGDSVGILENVEVMRPRDTSIPAAMQIELRSKPRAADAKQGVAFQWRPRSAQKQTTACLSYKVFFYADLEFQNGGVLPGLHGVDQSGLSTDGFTANLVWRDNGKPGFHLLATLGGEKQTRHFESKAYAFERAQWVKIDQEMILNQPGHDNGILRVWINGTLAIEQTNVTYRAKGDVSLSGVSANVGYGTPEAMTWAPSDTKIWISSVEFSWP